MPFAKREDKIAWGRQYYKENAEKIKVRERDKYNLNHTAIRERRNQLYNQNQTERSAQARQEYAIKRSQVIRHYGNKCACCRENEPLFLEIDHINNDGKIHRQSIGVGGRSLVLWIIRNNYPSGFQVLCSNCNQGKKRNGGICPHKKNTELSSARSQ